MIFASLVLLPAALIADRLFGEPPCSVHPVCLMGRLALRLEALLRRGKADTFRMFLAGSLAALVTALVWAGGGVLLVLLLECLLGAWAGFAAAVAAIYICLAPRCLEEHALRVAERLEAGDLDGGRTAVSWIVGRDTARLDAAGVSRACVETVAENLVDSVLSTLFWAGVGLALFGFSGAAGLVMLQRAMNTLDAMWGKKNETYIRFGTSGAVLDDVLNFLPARLSLLCIVPASRLLFSAERAWEALRMGRKFHAGHESPNSAWSEAAFAGALNLRLGGPARYGELTIEHPWIGEGSPDAGPEHIRLAVRLMWRSVIVFTVAETVLLGLLV